MNLPLVTIGIPTFNRLETYFPKTLECVRKQTYPNIEIVVADNCSTDGTEKFVASFVDPRIRYFRHQRSLVPNDNFNFCLSQARGEFFQLLHDDDLIDEDFIDVCMKVVAENVRVGLVRTGARIITEVDEVIDTCQNPSGGLSMADWALQWFSGKTPMFLCSTLFRTDCLKEVGGFMSIHQLFQDVLAEFMVAAKYGRIDICEIKASIRKHSMQMTHSKVKEWCEDSLYLLDAMCSMTSEKLPQLRAKGLHHFCVHNYEITSSLSSPIMRWRMWLKIYRMFGYNYSPMRYVLSGIRQRLSRVIRSRTKR